MREILEAAVSCGVRKLVYYSLSHRLASGKTNLLVRMLLVVEYDLYLSLSALG